MVPPLGTVILIVRVFASGLSPADDEASETTIDVEPGATAVINTESFEMLAVATEALGGVVIVYGSVPPESFAAD